jgi:hypothetical protein
MACKNCNLVKCGCQDSYLTTPPPCPTPEDCPDVQPCSEVFDAECIIYTGNDITCDQDIVVPTNTSLADAIDNITQYFCEDFVLPNDLECVFNNQTETVSTAGSTLEEVIQDIVAYYCTKVNALATAISNINNQLNDFTTGSSFTFVQTVNVNGCTETNYTLQLTGPSGNIGAPMQWTTFDCPTPCEAQVVDELNENIPVLGQATDSFILCRELNGLSNTAQILYTDLITELNNDLNPGGGGGGGLTFKTVNDPVPPANTYNIAWFDNTLNTTVQSNSTYYIEELNQAVVTVALLVPYDGSQNGGFPPAVGDELEYIIGNKNNWANGGTNVKVRISSSNANAYVGIWGDAVSTIPTYTEVNNGQSINWVPSSGYENGGMTIKLKCVEVDPGVKVLWIITDWLAAPLYFPVIQ